MVRGVAYEELVEEDSSVLGFGVGGYGVAV